MKRNMPQDIVPGKRSIRDISLPNRNTPARRKTTTTDVVARPVETVSRTSRMSDVKTVPVNREPSARTVERSFDTEPEVEEKEYDFDYDIDRPQKKSRLGIFSLLIVFVLALTFGIVTFFSSAKVVITPKSEIVPADITVNALKDQASGQFGYQMVSVSATVEKEVPATSDEQVSVKATGSILVYNTSATAQKLVATTRFESASGLVYRAATAVTVPKTTVTGGKTVPGSAVVAVAADQAGDSYNIGLTDFTLPGLKNTPQFKNIYGRSQTAMTGGFVGTRKKVSDADQTQANADLNASLQTSLQNQIGSQLPSNFILYSQSIAYDMGPVGQKATGATGKVVLTKTGTAQAVIFDRKVLSAALLQALSGSTPDATVVNLDELGFTLKDPAVLTKGYTGQISFNIKGDVHAVWNFDTAAVKSDLIGLKRANLEALLRAKYPSIESASASLFPIWKQSFPIDPSKITITIVKS